MSSVNTINMNEVSQCVRVESSSFLLLYKILYNFITVLLGVRLIFYYKMLKLLPSSYILVIVLNKVNLYDIIKIILLKMHNSVLFVAFLIHIQFSNCCGARATLVWNLERLRLHLLIN